MLTQASGWELGLGNERREHWKAAGRVGRLRGSAPPALQAEKPLAHRALLLVVGGVTDDSADTIILI